MIKKCICSLCNKEFNYNEYGDDFERECFKHEVIDHLNGDKKCKEIIEDTITDLKQKYEVNATLVDYTFNPYYDDYESWGTDNISISFKLHISSDILIEMNITCINNSFNLTKEMVLNEIEKYFIEKKNKRITGIVKFEDWSGGHGADDYIIDGMYLRDIMERLKGKNIEIKILDEK